MCNANSLIRPCLPQTWPPTRNEGPTSNGKERERTGAKGRESREEKGGEGRRKKGREKGERKGGEREGRKREGKEGLASVRNKFWILERGKCRSPTARALRQPYTYPDPYSYLKTLTLTLTLTSLKQSIAFGGVCLYKRVCFLARLHENVAAIVVKPEIWARGHWRSLKIVPLEIFLVDVYVLLLDFNF